MLTRMEAERPAVRGRARRRAGDRASRKPIRPTTSTATTRAPSCACWPASACTSRCARPTCRAGRSAASPTSTSSTRGVSATRSARCRASSVSRRRRRAPIVEAASSPRWCHARLVLARVRGSENLVLTVGEHGGETGFFGRGAGGDPDCRRGALGPALDRAAHVAPRLVRRSSRRPARHGRMRRAYPHYLRLVVRDKPGIIAALANSLAAHDLNIDAVLQEGGWPKDALPFVITLEPARRELVIAPSTRSCRSTSTSNVRYACRSSHDGRSALARRSPHGLRLVVPGSTSNLGPGFDALGLALQIYLELEVVSAADDGTGTAIHVRGRRRRPARTRSSKAILDEARRRDLRLPSLDLAVRAPSRCRPASAAAPRPSSPGCASSTRSVPTHRGRRRWTAPRRRRPRSKAIPTTSAPRSCGGLDRELPDPHRRDERRERLARARPVVVATPRLGLSTTTARGVLPAQISRGDAVHNVHARRSCSRRSTPGRSTPCATRSPIACTSPIARRSCRASPTRFAYRRPSMLGAFLSGAGPSIAAFVVDDAGPAERFFSDLFARLDLACAVRTLDVHQPDAVRARVAPPVLPSGVPA